MLITGELPGNQIDWPTMDDTANQAYRLSENTQVTGSDGDLAFGNKTLDAYKYATGAILVSAELMQDSAFDVEALVREAMAARLISGSTKVRSSPSMPPSAAVSSSSAVSRQNPHAPFTITNPGGFGSVIGTPIINQPQVAILATGAIKKRPVVIETDQGDSIAIRHMMYLSLSFTHASIASSL